jgi:hypothetical protein
MEWHIWPGLALVFSVERNGRYEGLIQPPSESFTICGTRKQMFYKQSMPLVSSSIAIEPGICLLSYVITGTYFILSVL